MWSNKAYYSIRNLFCGTIELENFTSEIIRLAIYWIRFTIRCRTTLTMSYNFISCCYRWSKSTTRCGCPWRCGEIRTIDAWEKLVLIQKDLVLLVQAQFHFCMVTIFSWTQFLFARVWLRGFSRRSFQIHGTYTAFMNIENSYKIPFSNTLPGQVK